MTISHSFQTPRAEKQMSVQISEAPEVHSNSYKQAKPFTLRLLNPEAEAKREVERRKQEEQERLEQEQREEIEAIMNTDDKLRGRCLQISRKAYMARKMSAQTANAVESMIHEYDDAIENFDETMTHVYETEIERLEAERKYLEFLSTNAGKDKGYFQIPSFLTKK